MEPTIVQKLTKEPHLRYFTPPPYCRYAERRQHGPHEDPISLNITISNPSKLIHFIEHLTDDCSKPLEVKINQYLMQEGESDTTFLIHLLTSSEEAMVQVIGMEELEKSLYFPVSPEVVKQLVKYENHVLKCEESLHPQILAILTGVYKKLGEEFVLIPILAKKHNYLACSTQNMKPVMLVCFVDSRQEVDYITRLSSELFRFCQTVLLNTMAGEEEARRNKRYGSVLRTARNLYPQLEEMNDLFTHLSFEARKLMNARRSSLFLLDPDKVTFIKTYFDGDGKFKPSLRAAGDEKLAKYVVTSGKIVNMKNPQQHPLFTRSIDEDNGIETKNILCFPIRDEDSIIGALQLCNKKGGNFTHLDEEVANIFGAYCGLSIMHSSLYKEKKETQQRFTVSNNLLLHDRSVKNDEVLDRMTCGLLHIHPQLDQFNLSPRSIPTREMVCFVLQMFEELGFIKTFSLNKERLTKFLMMVEKCHKDVPFHNWIHSFGCTHFAYLILKKLQVVEKCYISDLEALTYFLACLCHNLDHQGVNNPFQHKPFKSLACMYSSPGSLAEKHSFSQALEILNTEGCNFLESFDCKKYNWCLQLLRDHILAGDLANHFKLYSLQYWMVEQGYEKNNPQHRHALSSLLVTCSSFADQVKDWADLRQSMTDAIEEFITLGTIRGENEIQPVHLPLDKMRLVPDLQMDFLRTVCLPAFKLLALLFPEVKDLVLKIKENILYWEASKPVFVEALVSENETSCLEVLRSEEMASRVERALNALLNPK